MAQLRGWLRDRAAYGAQLIQLSDARHPQLHGNLQPGGRSGAVEQRCGLRRPAPLAIGPGCGCGPRSKPDYIP